MTPDSKTNEQAQFIVPDLTIKDLLGAIPAHCFKRSGLRSSTYVIWDFFLLACIYKTAEMRTRWFSLQSLNSPTPSSTVLVDSLCGRFTHLPLVWS